MENLIIAIEEKIKSEQFSIDYHNKEAVEKSQYHTNAANASYEKKVKLETELQQLRDMLNKA